MKRLLFIFLTIVALGLGASAAHAQVDEDCDGYDDQTGQPMRRASGVCGGVN